MGKLPLDKVPNLPTSTFDNQVINIRRLCMCNTRSAALLNNMSCKTDWMGTDYATNVYLRLASAHTYRSLQWLHTHIMLIIITTGTFREANCQWWLYWNVLMLNKKQWPQQCSQNLCSCFHSAVRSTTILSLPGMLPDLPTQQNKWYWLITTECAQTDIRYVGSCWNNWR